MGADRNDRCSAALRAFEFLACMLTGNSKLCVTCRALNGDLIIHADESFTETSIDRQSAVRCSFEFHFHEAKGANLPVAGVKFVSTFQTCENNRSAANESKPKVPSSFFRMNLARSAFRTTNGIIIVFIPGAAVCLRLYKLNGRRTIIHEK